MKVLLISSYLPFPLRSGGEIRLYNLLKNLSKDHDITLICEKREYQTKEDIEEVEKICKKVITVPRKKQWTLQNIIKTGLSQDPFLVVGHTTDEMKLAIRDELVRDNYGLIHVETFYIYQNLPKVSIPVVLVEHNVEYLAYQRFVNLANPFLRPFFYLDVLKIKQKEERAWKKADKLVAVSNFERKLMKRADVSIVPNGVDVDAFKFRSFQDIPQEKRILFIGDFKWFQNTTAAEIILKKIWPTLSLKISEGKIKANVKLWIVGRNIPEYIKNLASGKNIIIEDTNKEKTQSIFRKSYILLAPIKAGGGTSYKILESMASGVAVVTTNLGLEGLEAKNNVQALASENEDDLSDLVLKLVQDHTLYKRLTINARKFIEENYDWKQITKKLNDVYISCV